MQEQNLQKKMLQEIGYKELSDQSMQHPEIFSEENYRGRGILTPSPELDACLECLCSSRKWEGMSFSENNPVDSLMSFFQKDWPWWFPETYVKKAARAHTNWRASNSQVLEHAENKRPTLQKWDRNFSSTNSQNIFS